MQLLKNNCLVNLEHLKCLGSLTRALGRSEAPVPPRSRQPIPLHAEINLFSNDIISLPLIILHVTRPTSVKSEIEYPQHVTRDNNSEGEKASGEWV